MLSPDDQERFSRHLLLDRLGGLGQERICAGTVLIELSHSSSGAARSCARALSAAGVGTLILRGPWAPAVASECRELSASLACALLDDATTALPARPDVKVYSVHDPSSFEGASERTPARPPFEICLPADPRSPAEAAALGALAALEALKRLAQVGTPFVQTLEAFPPSAALPAVATVARR